MSSSQKPHAVPSHEVLDPVAAYDRLAPYYSQFSNHRAAYLRSVEEQIRSRVPGEAKSLLDIGAGDGRRALRIAGAAGISKAVLIEPSAKMSGAVPARAELWPVRVENFDLGSTAERFDVVTCLWNVLGHVQGPEKRAHALGVVAQLLSPDGRLFIDVIHRYNASSYGWVMTATRWLRDQLAPGETNGDVVARWQTNIGEISTYGHVFTDQEMRRLARSAGLECVERTVIDYRTGALRGMSCLGNMLYIFRRGRPSS